MNRCVLYSRFRSELQSASSIADQERALRAALPRLGLHEVAVYSDAAISGATLARPGLEAALRVIETGRADVLLAEALDRVSRDLEHVARIAKRVAFRGARMVTLSEGEIGTLHVALAGAMGAEYLRALAEKTRRGLAGVAASGRIPGGRAFGYRPTAQPGVFMVDEAEAQVVRRIFEEYAAGLSPRATAKALNAEGVRGPRGATWAANAIVGNRARGVGIVNNELYRGVIVWNRMTFRKDPETGKRRSFPLPDDQRVRTPAPSLQIVEDALWERVKEQQGEYVARGTVKRATRPLSGLIVCGECGTRLTLLGRDRYGCPMHKERGLCGNGRTAAAADVERRVLDGLRQHLATPEMVAAYAAGYVEERKRLRSKQDRDEKRIRREIEEAEREEAALIERIMAMPLSAAKALGEKLEAVLGKKEALEAKLAEQPAAAPVVDLHRVSAEHLSRNLGHLWNQLLADPVEAGKARDALAGLISRIIFRPLPKRGHYELEIEGDAAAFMGLGVGHLQKEMVAGAGFGLCRPQSTCVL